MTYTDEELRLLAGLPQLIGAAVASASGSGAIGTGKEFIAGATSLLEGLKSYPDNSITRQILPNPAADRSKALEWAKASREWVTQQVPTDGRPSRENLAAANLQAAEVASRLLNANSAADCEPGRCEDVVAADADDGERDR
jgi:NAD(P)H-hydrate repair Nnr-like enzyme with NAD(P)H-hydrate dehydratase domain